MAIAYVFKKIIASLLTFFILIGASTSSVPHGVEDTENIRLNFTAISDVHMEGNNYETFGNFPTILKDISDNTYGNDALVLVGDNTMNGQNIENMFLWGMLSKFKPADNILLALGNHDIGNGEGDYNELVSRYMGFMNAYTGSNITSPYYYKVINGYYFIFLASESLSVNQMDISLAQIEWLKNVMAEASASGNPIFIFSHHPYYYMSKNVAELREAIYSCENVFVITGHTHASISPYSFDNDGTHHFINLPRVTAVSDDGGALDADSGVGIQVEVYDDNVVVRARNYYDNCWLDDYAFTYDIVK